VRLLFHVVVGTVIININMVIHVNKVGTKSIFQIYKDQNL